MGFMDTIAVKPERKAQLEEYAQRHGQTAADALDEMIASYLEWEQQDHGETVSAVLEGYEDVKAGRTKPAEEVHESLRLKYGFRG
jgi:predicted transcriptional regulator